MERIRSVERGIRYDMCVRRAGVGFVWREFVLWREESGMICV